MNRGGIDWSSVERVLVVRLRSIGDTVLATPSFTALRRFLPDARIDVLLEDWVAPVLDGFDVVDDVLNVGRGTSDRIKTLMELRRRRYDVAFNLHGGTTATLFTVASGARHRIGFSHYQYSFLYDHRFPAASLFWQLDPLHSAEQQLALLGFAGVPVADRPASSLSITPDALSSIDQRLAPILSPGQPFALLHPASAMFTKQWSASNFAKTVEFLADIGLQSVAVASKNERAVLDELKDLTSAPVAVFDDLTLPEITAVASRASLFVGNDSGVAHIAAAVRIPVVVIFGSSNRDHWRPWTDAGSEIVFEPFSCQPCPGYVCAEFGEPRCILAVQPQQVFSAIERVLSINTKGEPLAHPQN